MDAPKQTGSARLAQRIADLYTVRGQVEADLNAAWARLKPLQNQITTLDREIEESNKALEAAVLAETQARVRPATVVRAPRREQEQWRPPQPGDPLTQARPDLFPRFTSSPPGEQRPMGLADWQQQSARINPMPAPAAPEAADLVRDAATGEAAEPADDGYADEEDEAGPAPPEEPLPEPDSQWQRKQARVAAARRRAANGAAHKVETEGSSDQPSGRVGGWGSMPKIQALHE